MRKTILFILLCVTVVTTYAQPQIPSTYDGILEYIKECGFKYKMGGIDNKDTKNVISDISGKVSINGLTVLNISAELYTNNYSFDPTMTHTDYYENADGAKIRIHTVFDDSHRFEVRYTPSEGDTLNGMEEGVTYDKDRGMIVSRQRVVYPFCRTEYFITVEKYTKKAWKNAVKMYKHREKKMKDNSKIERYIQF